MAKIASRIFALRQMHDLTGRELAELGGLDSPSPISKIEQGKNHLTSYPLRAAVARGFGLEMPEFDSYLRGDISTERAHALGLPRIRERLREIRARDDRAHADELEQAIEIVGAVEPAVLHFVRSLAAGGHAENVQGWVRAIKYLTNLRAHIISGQFTVPNSGAWRVGNGGGR